MYIIRLMYMQVRLALFYPWWTSQMVDLQVFQCTEGAFACGVGDSKRHERVQKSIVIHGYCQVTWLP